MRTVNQDVAGSSPARGANLFGCFRLDTVASGISTLARGDGCLGPITVHGTGASAFHLTGRAAGRGIIGRDRRRPRSRGRGRDQRRQPRGRFRRLRPRTYRHASIPDLACKGEAESRAAAGKADRRATVPRGRRQARDRVPRRVAQHEALNLSEPSGGQLMTHATDPKPKTPITPGCPPTSCARWTPTGGPATTWPPG